MKKTLLFILLTVLLMPVAASADTLAGSANPDTTKVFAFEPISSGQSLITLTWKRADADLFMVLVCDDIDWGVSAAEQDRIQRLDVGVMAGSACAVGVSSFSGSTRFWLNVQTTEAEPITRKSTTTRLVDLSDSRVVAVEELVEKVRAARK